MRRERLTMPKIIKAHSLTGRITPELMRQAFKAVKSNRGAAGVDKVSVEMFEANLSPNLDALMRDLKGRTFQTKPLRRVNIPKPGSTKTRPLGIPIVRDRVAQEVLRRLLELIFVRAELFQCQEPKFLAEVPHADPAVVVVVLSLLLHGP